MTRASAKRTPRAPLSRTRVLAAALKLADRGGIEAVSMRSVARALKVEAMSLYNHVTGKDDLLDGLVDVVVGEISVPRLDVGWKVAMRERALSAHAALTRHSWATMLFLSRANMGPNSVRYVDATISCLRAGGFSYPLADHAWVALDAYIYGFTLHQTNFPFKPEEYAAKAKEFLHLIPPDRFPGLHGMSQEVISGRHDGLQHLTFGLDLLLGGLEELRKRERRGR